MHSHANTHDAHQRAAAPQAAAKTYKTGDPFADNFSLFQLFAV